MRKYENANEYISLFETEGIENLIKVIKNNNLLVNSYSGKLDEKEEAIINRLNQYVVSRVNESEKAIWDKTLEEAKVINEIYYNFYNMPLNQADSSENELEAFLLVTEQFLQFLNNIIDGKKELNKKLGLNFSITGCNQYTKKEYCIKIHEELTRIIKLILSSLTFYQFPKHTIDIDRIVGEKEIESAYNHFSKATFNDLINYAVDSWKYGGRKIIKEHDTVKFEIVDDLDESYFIINERKENKGQKVYLETLQYVKENEATVLTSGANASYLSLEEFQTCVYMADYLSVDNLDFCTYTVKDMKYDRISIRELIRAYHILINLCKTEITSREIEKSNLRDWALIVNDKELQNLFSKNEIKVENIDWLIKQLTYRKGVDICDAPLIKIGQQYLLLPNLLIKLEVAKLVLSLVNEIKLRGTLFEKSIEKWVNNGGLKCCNLYIKDPNEYQCDLAIVIANNLYLCECKAWNEFWNMAGYYDMIQKMNDAKGQLDRIADKFLEEIDYVNKELGFDENHKFNKIEKLVITLNMLGLYRKIDDVYFIDYSCLTKFLDREKPGVRVYGKDFRYIEYEGYEEYKGKINNCNFMNMIKDPANIKITRENKKIGTNVLEINGMKVVIPMYEKKESTTKWMSRESLR